MGTCKKIEKQTHLFKNMICYHQVFLIVTSAICMTRSSDECSHGQWMCQDKSCILREKVCDSVPDCPKGDDERGVCSSSSGSCPDFMFTCNNFQCVSQVIVCNGKQDCSDGSDETCNIEKVTEKVVNNRDIYYDQQRSAGSRRRNLATVLTFIILIFKMYS